MIVKNLIEKRKWILIVGLILLFGFASLASAVSNNQAPELQTKVENGELPPLEKRLPDNPVVVEEPLIKNIGTYGGTLTFADTNVAGGEGTENYNMWGWGGTTRSGPGYVSLIRGQLIEITYNIDEYGKELIPAIAKSWEWSEDGEVFTVHLREGVKWSDGEEFTTDDIAFSYNDIVLNENTPISKEAWKRGGKPIELKVIDKYTFQFRSDQVLPFIAEQLTMNAGNVLPLFPKHIVKKSHPEYNSEATYEDLGTARPKENPVTLGAYTLNKIEDGRYGRLVRNPYYWKVDSEGNQLPYIDEVLVRRVQDNKTVGLRFMSGEFDIIPTHNFTSNQYTTIKRSESEGGYWYELQPLLEGMTFHLNRFVEDENLKKVFNKSEFKKALSLALDRDALVSMTAPGRAVPHRYTFSEISPYHNEGLGLNPEYNTQKAKDLLEQMDLIDRDNDGIREFADGSDLSFNMQIQTRATTLWETVVSYWKDIGIEANLKVTPATQFWTKWLNGNFETVISRGGWAPAPLTHSDWFVPRGESGEPTRWFVTGWSEPELKARDLFDQTNKTLDKQKRYDLMKKAEKILVENYRPGTLEIYRYRKAIGAQNNIGNVPKQIKNKFMTRLNQYAYAFYFTD